MLVNMSFLIDFVLTYDMNKSMNKLIKKPKTQPIRMF